MGAAETLRDTTCPEILNTLQLRCYSWAAAAAPLLSHPIRLLDPGGAYKEKLSAIVVILLLLLGGLLCCYCVRLVSAGVFHKCIKAPPTHNIFSVKDAAAACCWIPPYQNGWRIKI
jgi:hypothetical protein